MDVGWAGHSHCGSTMAARSIRIRQVPPGGGTPAAVTVIERRRLRLPPCSLDSVVELAEATLEPLGRGTQAHSFRSPSSVLTSELVRAAACQSSIGVSSTDSRYSYKSTLGIREHARRRSSVISRAMITPRTFWPSSARLRCTHAM